MNILLHTQDKSARERYLDLSIKTLGKSYVTRILRDRDLFWSLFELFQYEHFRSRDKNMKSGLSIRGIVSWYPVIAGVRISAWSSSTFNLLNHI